MSSSPCPFDPPISMWLKSIVQNTGRSQSSFPNLYNTIGQFECETWNNCPTYTCRAVTTTLHFLFPFMHVYIFCSCVSICHSSFFQYVSLLRPPITDSSAPGADIIDKVEWKQVKYHFKTNKFLCYLRPLYENTVTQTFARKMKSNAWEIEREREARKVTSLVVQCADISTK